MPKFEITFEREVVQRDRCTRIIEADTLEAAQEIGDGMASEFDHDCPDDAGNQGSVECQSWEARMVRTAPEDAVVDD